MPIKEYREKETAELKEYRANFRDNYTFIEAYCKHKFNSGNYLDLLSKETNLIETCTNEIEILISQEYIKSNSFGFNVTPSVKNATDFLRIEMIGTEGEHQYKKSSERAVYEILQQLRDNLTHDGKFEVSEEQFERNSILIKNASIISNSIVKILENYG